MSSLSSLSVPARSKSFPPRASRNFLLRPINQFSQNGLVADKLVRQTQGLEGSAGWPSSYIKEGTEARAEVEFRIVRDRVLQIAWFSDLSRPNTKTEENGVRTAIQFLIPVRETGLVV